MLSPGSRSPQGMGVDTDRRPPHHARPPHAAADMPFKVAFLGFTDFERSALTSYFRLALNRQPAYEQVATLTDAEYLVADADHAPSVQLVVATERLQETVFVGAQAPAGHRAWMMRPIDALQVMRELDQMVVAAGGTVIATGDDLRRQTTVVQPPRRTRVEEAGERLAAEHEPAMAPPQARPRAEPAVPPPRAYRELPVLSEPVDLVLPNALSTEPPASPPRARVAAPQQRPPAPPQPAARVLLVDDSELALRFLETKLARWKPEIDLAATSGAALELLEQRPYDLVFLDVELGPESEMGGLELCRHIKNSAAGMNAAIVMVSVHNSEMDRVRGALAGCDAYLGKPLDEVELQRLMLRQGYRVPKDAGATQT